MHEEENKAMKINEVEKLVDITKKNIRYYEQEGLLHPDRNLENGYRDYTEKDVEELKKVKLLRKLSIPIDEIRMIQTGKLNLEDALGRHLIILKREEEKMHQLQTFCQAMIEDRQQYRDMDCDSYFEQMEVLEKGGMKFVNVESTDSKKKKQGSMIAAGLIILWLAIVIGVACFLSVNDTPPLPVLILMVGIPLVVIAAIIVALYQRFKEIDKGEQDEARKY